MQFKQPIGTHRIWRESFIEHCSSRIKTPPIWEMVGQVNKTNIRLNAPEAPGIYAFVRRSKLEKLTPFAPYPLIVYVGQAINLRSRLLQYEKEKKSAFRHTPPNVKIRNGIRTMFREYGDGLQIYVFECDQLDLVMIEDALIKLLDPIFNEGQKLVHEIPESSTPLLAVVEAPEAAYAFPLVAAPLQVEAQLQQAIPAF